MSIETASGVKGREIESLPGHRAVVKNKMRITTTIRKPLKPVLKKSS